MEIEIIVFFEVQLQIFQIYSRNGMCQMLFTLMLFDSENIVP